MPTLQEKALALALKAHAGQVDKDGDPYIIHILGVATKFANDPVLFAAVLCHAVVEGTFGTANQITIQDIVNELGLEVGIMVDALTRHDVGMQFIAGIDPAVTYAYAVEREVYIDGFIQLIAAQPPVNLLKTEDIYDNLDPRSLNILTEDQLGRVRRYHRALNILYERNSVL